MYVMLLMIKCCASNEAYNEAQNEISKGNIKSSNNNYEIEPSKVTFNETYNHRK